MSRPTTSHASPATLDDPLYYLHNFRWLVEWVVARHGDLLNDAEHQFAVDLKSLPVASQGLLVRMVMRKGQIFRADKLNYPELGDAALAAVPLIERGWVTSAPVLDLPALFKLLTWPELRRVLAAQLAGVGLGGARKGDALAALSALSLAPATPTEWGIEIPVYQLELMPLCERFRLMFFGNAHQDWSEFVLTELGTFQYEPVEFSNDSRPFHSRAEIDACLQIHACRERFYDAELFDEATLKCIASELPALPSANPWLVARRDRLVFKIAREWERAGELVRARELYSQCIHPGARGRHLRVLECEGEYQLALKLAEQAQDAPESEAERQQLQRLIPRLRRKLGQPRTAAKAIAKPCEQLELTLPFLLPVEVAAKQHLESDEARVYYVENTLLSGFFGLLCWDAIFAPLPGAFFHPFQRAPADLHWPDFYQRREQLFDACLHTLEDGSYRARILDVFNSKYGRQSPFVYWDALSETLLEQALNCIPAAHLKLCFERMLRDLKANCAGLPDLIQLWPAQRRYRMIEVKGPGDRLQDNQLRWLDFFALHNMPVAVCYVRWRDGDNQS